ncbi:MAG: hypothetical protein IKX82_00470 [Bacilli bacterium]|nr:hypothetical protein [Bacilli bacterium]
MTDAERQRNYFYYSILFFILALVMLLYIGFPILSGVFGRGVLFYNGSDKTEWLDFFIAACVPIGIYLGSLVLMNVFFAKSRYGCRVAFRWWIPIAICASLLIIFIVTTFFLWIILFCIINYIVFSIGFGVLMLNTIGLCSKGAQKNPHK